jgi:hypothetical protein
VATLAGARGGGGADGTGTNHLLLARPGGPDRAGTSVVVGTRANHTLRKVSRGRVGTLAGAREPAVRGRHGDKASFPGPRFAADASENFFVA